jgi:DNA-directed RNA polymerase subunit RPC12/RpoP
MNPHWIRIIHQTIKKAAKKCPHCGRTGTYAKKQAGRFYLCKYCGHRFKEKSK